MTIAVHIHAGKHEDLSENLNFVCFSQLAAGQPGSHFIFIFDSAPHPEIYMEQNCTPVILAPVVKNFLLRHYWYNYKLPAVIQRYNTDILITDAASCSMRLATPQCMLLQAENLIAAEKNIYLKRFLPAFFKKARHIFTVDEIAFEWVQKKYDVTSKASLLFPGLRSEMSALTFEKREEIKAKFTSGNEYFFHITASSDFNKIKVLLKAFSIFKKWQHSAMKMVFVVGTTFKPLLFQQLASYKYKEDVLIFTSFEESEILQKAAYAKLIAKDDLHTNAIAAMKTKVPVILDVNHKSKLLADGALTTIWDEKDISGKMMALYKDESLRNDFIERGLAQAARYSWQITCKKIWETLSELDR